VDCFNLMPCSSDQPHESDILLTQTLKRWAENEVMAKRLEYREDLALLLKPAQHKLFVDLEMQKLLFPEEYGGVGLNKPEVAHTLALSLEQVGRADTGIGFLFAATFALCSSFTMDYNLNNDLCRQLAPLFCHSEKSAVGSLVLPGYDSEIKPASQTLFHGRSYPAAAKQLEGRVIIEGSNLQPLNAGSDADLFGVLCRLEGSDEPIMVVIPANSPGFSRGEQQTRTGLAASVNSKITLDQVTVPESSVVFRGETGRQQLLSWLYLGVSAVTVGSLFAVYEILREWGENRVIKGKNSLLKDNPLTASVMAEVSQELLLDRLLLHQLAGIIASRSLEEPARAEKTFIAALSVVSQVTNSAEKAINQAMELMGSAGYATEWNLERYWRDIKTMQLHLGSWELNKMDLARFFYRSENI
jgi:alkylation response protein AidB-like acyl-CoA dehydrogenase